LAVELVPTKKAAQFEKDNKRRGVYKGLVEAKLNIATDLNCSCLATGRRNAQKNQIPVCYHGALASACRRTAVSDLHRHAE
jgi:hypothetical protein